MSIVSICPIFAEPVDVEIDWTIEGQPKTIVNPTAEDFIDYTPGIDVNTINEKIQKKSLGTSTETKEFADLITGSGFSVGTRLI
ncbi:MAG: hypothetical protein MUP75_01795, partial [Nitrosopumilus sp.]|nr:hypothetical protein [Nitrosopumilus sp.]